MASNLIASNVQITVRLVITKAKGSVVVQGLDLETHKFYHALKEVGTQEINATEISSGESVHRVYPDHETTLRKIHKRLYDFTFKTKSVEPVPDDE